MKNSGIFVMVALFVILSFLMSFGALFKIMHWRGANEMVIGGMGTAFVVCVGCFIYIVREFISQDIDNKPIWIICLLISLIATSILYFVNKETLRNKV